MNIYAEMILRQKVGNCATRTISGEKKNENLYILPIDKFGKVWYNGISGRHECERPAAEYLCIKMNKYSAHEK